MVSRATLVRQLSANRIYPILLITFVVLALSTQNFASQLNLRGTLTTASTNILVAAGLTLVLVCGEIDMSVGSTVSLATMLAVGWQSMLGLAGAVLVAVLAGGLVGLVNGILVARLGVNSILATLGTMIIVNGAALSVANGGTVSAEDITPALRMQEPIWQFLTLTSAIALAAALVLHVALSQTPWGRSLYVVGGSEDGGRLAGLRTDRLRTSAFVLCGLMAAGGGVLLGLGLNTGSPSFGASTMFTVIAAAVVGGTSLLGAEGGVLKSLAGVLTLQFITNAMTLAGVKTFTQTIVNGTILLVVVLLDSYFGRRRRLAWASRSIESGQQ
jgi:ribose transport system permease protein